MTAPKRQPSLTSLSRLNHVLYWYRDSLQGVRWSGPLHWAIFGETLVLGGSDSVEDWKYNLNFFPTKSPTGPGLVHSGFLNIAERTLEQLVPMIEGGQVIRHVTGFSLGGAVALLVAERLKGVEVVTFGAPAVGTAGWASRYPHPVTRCVVSPDWFTAPLWNRHVGESVKIKGGWNPISNHIFMLSRDWD